MTPHLKRVLGSLPDGFLTYFTRRFPHLFLHVYNVIASTPVLRTEALFKDYFTVEDADH